MTCESVRFIIGRQDEFMRIWQSVLWHWSASVIYRTGSNCNTNHCRRKSSAMNWCMCSRASSSTKPKELDMASRQNPHCMPRKSIRSWVKNSVRHRFWCNNALWNYCIVVPGFKAIPPSLLDLQGFMYEVRIDGAHFDSHLFLICSFYRSGSAKWEDRCCVQGGWKISYAETGTWYLF